MQLPTVVPVQKPDFYKKVFIVLFIKNPTFEKPFEPGGRFACSNRATTTFSSFIVHRK